MHTPGTLLQVMPRWPSAYPGQMTTNPGAGKSPRAVTAAIDPAHDADGELGGDGAAGTDGAVGVGWLITPGALVEEPRLWGGNNVGVDLAVRAVEVDRRGAAAGLGGAAGDGASRGAPTQAAPTALEASLLTLATRPTPATDRLPIRLVAALTVPAVATNSTNSTNSSRACTHRRLVTVPPPVPPMRLIYEPP
jgi:hypothetical protein